MTIFNIYQFISTLNRVMSSTDIDKLAQEALQAAQKKRVGAKSTTESTAALVSLHSRLLSGKVATPNLVRDKNGICIQKKEESASIGTVYIS